MEESINPDGFWSDFQTLAGESVYWVTGYVGCALSHDEETRGMLQEVGSRIIGRQGEDGGWGYGPWVPADADSTSWCLMFLSGTGALDPKGLEKASAFLLAHQSPSDGGFRTYASPRDIGRYMGLDGAVSFEGWSTSQTCVTGAAVQALVGAGHLEEVRRALEFIRGTQTVKGYWNAYWWTDSLYSTVLCMEALAAAGRGREVNAKDDVAIARARRWIAETQLPDGGWHADGWPFSTALALRGLMLRYEAGPLVDVPEIRKGVEWLLARQRADGSWGEHHILRIPHPSAKEPWKQSEWKEDGMAINSAIKDQRRLYTTATVFAALSEFKKGFVEREDRMSLHDS